MSASLNLYEEALERFSKLLAEAKKTDLDEPTAMALATADDQGRPSVRIVLLKGFDENGFVFYTNVESRKGRQISVNPQASICFHWQPLKKQVTIEGTVQLVSKKETDAYWKTRPRNSQIGAWASDQSKDLVAMPQLLDNVEKYAALFAGQEVPRPPHWSGYRIIPDRIEFWTSRPFRLHERIVYEKQDGGWSRKRLNP